MPCFLTDEDMVRLVRDWWPYCQRWAWRRDRLYPGTDHEEVANQAFWKTMQRHDPKRGGFGTFLMANLRNVQSVARQTECRRKLKLPRVRFDEAVWLDRQAGDMDPPDSILSLLDRVTDRQRQSIERVILCEESWTDAGQMMGVNRKVVNEAVERGLNRIKKLIESGEGS